MKSFSTRRKVLCVIGLVGVWFAYRSFRQPPIDLSLKISQSRPLPVTQKLVGDVKVLIDGQDIVRDNVVVQSRAPIAITGECREQTVEHPLGMIVIGYRKSGTPESSWEKFDHSHEWMYPKSTQFEFLQENRVNAEPGDYDIKVYVASLSLRTNIPIMEHVLDGHMKVIPKRYDNTTQTSR